MSSRKVARQEPVNVADELVESMRQAVAIAKNEMPPARAYPARAKVDVRAIRKGLGLSQTAFANRFGFSPSAVREWEYGRRQPEAAARVLLLVIAHSPETVDAALQAGEPVAA